MSTKTFLDGRVTLHGGDCLEVLATLPEASVDSVACDPPYHLVSIVKRFGAKNAAKAKVGKTGAYARASAGFMGKQWDGGDIAFRVELWAQVLRVLKPGGHLLAFSGTRTYHRMVCAIEDAGFDVRDQIGWAYGSGFPKSHDVSKSIDRRGGAQVAWFGPWLRGWRAENGIKQADISALFRSATGRKTGCVANWELGLNMPTPEQFNAICKHFNLPFASLQQAERVIVGNNDRPAGWFTSGDGHDITEPSSDAAKHWNGWGTALKPAWEPIVLARKPLAGSVAENVLEYGTGGINIDGCRVGAANGRWPANVIHDGSEEVLAAFPDAPGQQQSVGPEHGAKASVNVYGDYGPRDTFAPRGDAGSAARFFYTAKADAEDRLGSKHPTVKPLDLMQWLVRLVTPKGGTVLDPFAGTGTTGEAAWREGMNAVLIEREPEYQEDIARRMDLATKPTKRAAVAASKNNLEDPALLPLFAGETL